MRVLAASDFSEASDEALRQGHTLVKAVSGVLGICHVIPLAPHVHALAPQEYEQDIESLLAMTPKVSEALRERARSVLGADLGELEICALSGEVYAEIIRHAEAWRADRIVVGSIGRTGLARLLLGSVAERIVRYAHCPVMVARKSEPGAVLVGTDLSEASLAALHEGAREASRRGTKLIVLFASEVLAEYVQSAGALFGPAPPAPPLEIVEQRQIAARQLLTDALARIGATAELVVVEELPEQAILRRAETLPAELIVVGTRGRTGVQRVALGSVAERVVRAAHCSVLVVKSESGA